MIIKYTNTLEAFEAYCNERFLEYIDKNQVNETERKKAEEYYKYELELIRKHIKLDVTVLRSLWVSVLFEHISQKYNLNIRVTNTPYLLIMYLLNLLPYNVLEEEGIERELIHSQGNFNFEVGETFYKKAKYEIEDFFIDTGIEYLWLGQKCDDDRKLHPAGIAVLPIGQPKFAYKENCRRLYDETICFYEGKKVNYGQLVHRNLTYFYIKLTPVLSKLDKDFVDKDILINRVKHFEVSRLDLLEADILDPAEQLALEYYKPEVELQIKKALSYAWANFECLDKEVRETLWKWGIVTREALYNYFRAKGIPKEESLIWTTNIRKGRFAHLKEQKSQGLELLSEFEKRIFSEVRYLPSYNNILSWFLFYKRCVIQDKIYNE